MHKLPFFVLVLLFSLDIAAQGSISGTIVDKVSKKNIEFANVQLKHAKDSSIAKATVTDRKGKFDFEGITEGNYFIESTFIGYDKSQKPVSVLGVQKVNVGVIEIFFLAATTQDVTVTTTRSQLNTSIDRKTYDVSKDIMAQSGAASDVLRNIPSVEVDIEGNLSLRGSGDVMILINGRPSPLMGRTRAEVLQQLPANTIERIEVITNPSSRYKPDGTSGIINIVLKKNTKAGWNGNLTGNAGVHERYSSAISLNYKPGKVNLFSNYSIRRDYQYRLRTLDRITYNASLEPSYYSENTPSIARPLAHVFTIGADYDVDDNNSVGISFNNVDRKLTRHETIQKQFYDRNKQLTQRLDRIRFDPEREDEKDATLYWQHNFPKEDHELRVELNASTQDEVEDNRFTDKYFFPFSKSFFENTLIKVGDNQQQVSIDYVNPLSEASQLEAGYSGSFIQQDLNFFGEYYDTSKGKFIKDFIKSNQFLYNEYVHALYGVYQRSFDKFSYSVGLRLEQAIIKGNLVTRDSLINNSYFKIYPTLHLAYELDNGEVQWNYSRRVNRPEGDELNPFPEYSNPQNLYAGNPKLLPEIIHSVEFGYKWQDKNFSFVPSLYYRYKQNGFTTVTIPLNDSVLLTTEQNLSNDQSAGLELIFSAKAGTFFNANLSSNFFYNKIDASDLGYSNKKTIVSTSTSLNSNFTLSKTTMLQVTCNYKSARLTPQGKSYGNIVINTGLRQDLFKKKLSVILTASDLFKTLVQKSEINTPFIKQTSISRRDSRIIYLGFSYKFGGGKKQDEEKIQFDNSL